MRSAGARAAQEFDESGEGDAEAHSANDELKEVDGAEHAERRALGHIEKSGGAKKQGDEDARGDVAVVIGHAGLLEIVRMLHVARGEVQSGAEWERAPCDRGGVYT